MYLNKEALILNLVEELREISKTKKLNNTLKLKIICSNSKVIEGTYNGYTQAIDNDPEVASIGIKTDEFSYELNEDEIESIEVIR